MLTLLQRTSNWKFILPLFVLFRGVSFYVFPTYQAKMNKVAGVEIQPLDTRFSYILAEVTNDFEKLGAKGRDLYKLIVDRIDMIYPIIYGVFLF